MKNVSNMGEENFGKLVKLVNDFDGFGSIRELNAIIYLNNKLRKDFDYNSENFEFYSEKGGDNKEIEWDIVSLELADILTTKESVKITENGKRMLEECPIEIDFSNFKDNISTLDRKLWPAAALYLYANDYYFSKPPEKQKEIAKTVLQKYGFNRSDIVSVEHFLRG